MRRSSSCGETLALPSLTSTPSSTPLPLCARFSLSYTLPLTLTHFSGSPSGVTAAPTASCQASIADRTAVYPSPKNCGPLRPNDDRLLRCLKKQGSTARNGAKLLRSFIVHTFFWGFGVAGSESARTKAERVWSLGGRGWLCYLPAEGAIGRSVD